jgi:hypothetical protein
MKRREQRSHAVKNEGESAGNSVILVNMVFVVILPQELYLIDL